MSVYEVVPDELKTSTRTSDFLDWLKVYPAPSRIKKAILHDWCVQLDVPMERWMVEFIGAAHL